jgi:predicted transglutaminase-like cysteine proteinase
MKRRFGSVNRSAVILAALLFFSISGYATSAAHAENVTADEAAGLPVDGVPRGTESAQAPATFFTINAVLAKLDRERGRGPNAARLAALTPPSLSDAQPEPTSAPATGEEPFGLFTFRAPEGALWRKWRGVQADLAKERVVLESCRDHAEGCPSYAAQFLRLVKAAKSKSGRAQLEEVNQGVNMAIRYVSDLAQFGELDHWSTPLASFATAKGDCEDYAIAKYVALREAGFPEGELRILLVRDRSVGQDHAVLAARLEGRWLILDNRWSELREDSVKLNLTPLFAIDRSGLHMFAAPLAKRQPGRGQTEPAPAAQPMVPATGSDRGSIPTTVPVTMFVPF